MAGQIVVTVRQQSATTSQGEARGHKVLIDRPVHKEGTDFGMMGGEMLLVALGGCFNSNLLAAIRARQADISNVHIEITGTLTDNPTRYTAIQLDITAQYSDPDLMEKLVTMSERACIVANSIRGAIDLKFNIRQAQNA
jgi:putative redox protein